MGTYAVDLGAKGVYHVEADTPEEAHDAAVQATTTGGNATNSPGLDPATSYSDNPGLQATYKTVQGGAPAFASQYVPGFDYAMAGGSWLGDKALGFVTSNKGGIGDDTFNDNLKAVRTGEADYKANNPLTAGVMETAGAFTNPLYNWIGGKANSIIGGTGKLATGAKLATGGAGIGAVAGLTNAAGDDGGLPTVGQAAEDTATGAGIGALTGVALPSAVGAAVGVGKAVTAGVGNLLSKILDGPESQGGRLLLKNMQRDFPGVPVEQLVQMAKDKLTELGPEATIADLGGNVTGLAESAATRPGPSLKAAEDLSDRQGGQFDRIRQAALKAAGVAHIDEAKATRSVLTRPLYDEAFGLQRDDSGNITGANKSKAIVDPYIQSMMEEPDAQAALNRGMREQNLENKLTGAPVNLEDYNVERDPQTGQMKRVGYPNLRQLDVVRRGFDALANDDSPGSGMFNENGTRTNLGRLYAGHAEKFDNILSQHAPLNPNLVTADNPTGNTYLAARNSWRHMSGPIDALNTIDTTLSRSRDANDVTSKLYGSQDARDKIAGLTPNPDKMAAFNQLIQNEKELAANNKQLTSNSRTAYRSAAQQDLKDEANHPLAKLADNPSPENLVVQPIRAAWKNLFAPAQDVSDSLAPMFSRDPATRDAMLDSVQSRINGRNVAQKALGKVGDYFSNIGGDPGDYAASPSGLHFNQSLMTDNTTTPPNPNTKGMINLFGDGPPKSPPNEKGGGGPNISRRGFLKGAAAAGIKAATPSLPVSLTAPEAFAPAAEAAPAVGAASAPIKTSFSQIGHKMFDKELMDRGDWYDQFAEEGGGHDVVAVQSAKNDLSNYLEPHEIDKLKITPEFQELDSSNLSHAGAYHNVDVEGPHDIITKLHNGFADDDMGGDIAGERPPQADKDGNAKYTFETSHPANDIPAHEASGYMLGEMSSQVEADLKAHGFSFDHNTGEVSHTPEGLKYADDLANKISDAYEASYSDKSSKAQKKAAQELLDDMGIHSDDDVDYNGGYLANVVDALKDIHGPNPTGGSWGTPTEQARLQAGLPTSLTVSEDQLPKVEAERKAADSLMSNEVNAGKRAIPDVSDIHAQAQKLGIAYDNNKDFMNWTQALIGKAHLDDMTPLELQKVQQALPTYQVKPSLTQSEPPASANETEWFNVPHPHNSKKPPIEVAVNPSYKEALKLANESPDGTIRTTRIDGKTYMWDAYNATHDDIHEQLAKMGRTTGEPTATDAFDITNKGKLQNVGDEDHSGIEVEKWFPSKSQRK